MSVRAALIGVCALMCACAPPTPERAAPPPPPAAIATAVADGPAPEEGSLAWAVAGDWRTGAERARDPDAHPLETLEFFGIENNMRVVEAYPGLGWMTAILAPYLARGGGALIVATFDPEGASEAQRATREAFLARFAADPERYGAIAVAALSPTSEGVAPAGTVDLVIAHNVVHTLMAEGFADKAFRDFYDALAPGGALGIVQHRAAPSGLQDPKALSGYVQEAYVRALAEEAGFVFAAASDLNANPKDDRDHPFGVWTLPPTLLTAPIGAPADPSFDSAPYRAIGESDRMTLLFRKPARR